MISTFSCEIVAAILSASLFGFSFLLWKKSRRSKKLERFEILLREVSKVHNRGLEFVFKKLENRVPIEEIEPIQSYIQEFIKSEGFFKSKDSAIEVVAKRFDKITENSTDNIPFNIDKNINDQISDIQIYFHYIDDAISCFDDVEKINRVLDTFEYLDFKNIKEMDRYVVIASVKIAKGSMAYWNGNYEKWEQLIDKRAEAPKKKWFKWKEVGRDDIKGAVEGTVSYGINALLFGPSGLAVAASSIAADAISSSAISAGKQLINRFKETRKSKV